MIRSIRCRPVEKPIITQEIIYNHREEQVDTGSQFSFLRTSQNASKQLSNEYDPFTAMEMRIYNVEQRSAIRLNEVKRNIGQLEDEHVKNRVKVDMALIDQNKQNFMVAYRKIPFHDEKTQRIDTSNFQMDQNFNYIKNKQKKSQFDSVKLDGKIQLPHKEFYSLQNSRRQEKIKKKLSARSGSLNSVRSLSAKNEIKQEVSDKKQNKVLKQVNKTRKSSSLVRKRGRIYQQILSLYTIPKLLAMEPKIK